jgi:cold shock CspA family protein
MADGLVKWFDPNEDVFVHIRDVERAGLEDNETG